LQRIAALEPDLCVTAAYGNILPQRFLDIPRFGTLNIHPSLLPQFRGAAPVQRALQARPITAVGEIEIDRLGKIQLQLQFHMPYDGTRIVDECVA